MKKRLLPALCVVFVSTSAVAESTRAIVLDAESKTVAVVDAAKGTVGERVALTDTPLRMVLSPDGKRIAVLSRGEGKTSFWTSHFNPTSKSSVTFIDASAMKPIARVELGWDLGRATFSSDSASLTVLTPGVASSNAEESKPAELIRINSQTGETLKRVTLDHAAGSFDVSSNGTTGAVFFKGGDETAAQLRLIDVGSLDTVATIPLSNSTESPVALIKDRLYLLDSHETRAGKMYIVSLIDRKLMATLDAGDRPLVGAVDPDRENIFLLNGNGQFRILNGTTISPAAAVAKNPKTIRFSDDKKIAYVISDSAVTTVDLMKMTASTPIKIHGFASDFVASPDGRRGRHAVTGDLGHRGARRPQDHAGLQHAAFTARQDGHGVVGRHTQHDVGALGDRERKLAGLQWRHRIAVDRDQRAGEGTEVDHEIGRGGAVDDTQPDVGVLADHSTGSRRSRNSHNNGDRQDRCQPAA